MRIDVEVPEHRSQFIEACGVIDIIVRCERELDTRARRLCGAKRFREAINEPGNLWRQAGCLNGTNLSPRPINVTQTVKNVGKL
jgi:hypothetical protein